MNCHRLPLYGLGLGAGLGLAPPAAAQVPDPGEGVCVMHCEEYSEPEPSESSSEPGPSEDPAEVARREEEARRAAEEAERQRQEEIRQAREEYQGSVRARERLEELGRNLEAEWRALETKLAQARAGPASPRSLTRILMPVRTEQWLPLDAAGQLRCAAHHADLLRSFGVVATPVAAGAAAVAVAPAADASFAEVEYLHYVAGAAFDRGRGPAGCDAAPASDPNVVALDWSGHEWPKPMLLRQPAPAGGGPTALGPESPTERIERVRKGIGAVQKAMADIDAVMRRESAEIADWERAIAEAGGRSWERLPSMVATAAGALLELRMKKGLDAADQAVRAKLDAIINAPTGDKTALHQAFRAAAAERETLRRTQEFVRTSLDRLGKAADLTGIAASDPQPLADRRRNVSEQAAAIWNDPRVKTAIALSPYATVAGVSEALIDTAYDLSSELAGLWQIQESQARRQRYQAQREALAGKLATLERELASLRAAAP